MIADAVLDAWLAEDAPYGDLTTRMLGIGGLPGRVRFCARDEAVTCCVEEAVRLFSRAGCEARALHASGDRVAAGEPLLEANGPAASLHQAWKTAQTLVEQTSGVATAARRIVDAARAVAPDIAVECTRKSLAGTRAIAVRAVLAGGASMHRLGLSDSVLIFAEHAAFAGGWASVCARIGDLKRRHPGHGITAEAHSAEAALALGRAGCDVVQVDKFSPEAVRALVEAMRAESLPTAIAAAGGINADNAATYAATGCAILVTSAPYWAKPADVQVTIEPA